MTDLLEKLRISTSLTIELAVKTKQVEDLGKERNAFFG